MSQSLEERAKLFEKDFRDLLNKYNLSWTITSCFPVYNILPSEVKLALTVLEKHGIEYKLAYSEKQK